MESTKDTSANDSMKGRVCLITGATAGIGREAAFQLARMGATMVLVGRSEERCGDTVGLIKEQTGNPSVEYLVADLSVQSEIKKLAEDFVARIGILEDLLQQVEALAPERVVTIRQKLEDKLALLLTPGQVDENRLLMEISILAERSDVTEECVRFYSHNAQFLETMKRNEAVGRRLNFLLQEMLREANTIGSKAGDAEIAHLVVEMKEEIEKLKEQVQNIE